MKSPNRFWNLKPQRSMRIACSLFIFAAVTIQANADDSTAWVGSPEAFSSHVWVPADAMGVDSASRVRHDSRVMQVDYEEAAPEEMVRPAPEVKKSKKSKGDLSDPGLIVPIEELDPALETEPLDDSSLTVSEPALSGPVPRYTMDPVPMDPATMPSSTMVPGSMRVLQVSDPVMITTGQPWEWHILPSNLLWHSYLAGPREPRISSTFVRIKGDQDYWDATVGGRASLLRFGTDDPRSPEGVEVQVEGAAFPRLTLDYDRDLVASDYRFGFPLVYHRGPFEAKFSYYHLSSHFGDEYLIKHPELIDRRINYSRDAFTLAVGYFPWRDLRVYGEVGYAVWCDGGSRPWEFQFGVDYSPARPTTIWGAPFFAVNGHLHQELNYSGGFTAQAGVQWRGQTGRLLRFGFQYFNGMGEQYQFYRQFEQQIGGGIWYDF